MSQRVPKRSTRILCAAAAVAALAAVAPSGAGADNTQYLNGTLNSGVSARVGDLTRTALESSRAWADLSGHSISVAAHDSGNLNPYGSWQTVATYSCVTYSPNVNKGAMVYNPEIFTQFPAVATSGWRGSGADYYC
jgi:hypothetical protein